MNYTGFNRSVAATALSRGTGGGRGLTGGAHGSGGQRGEGHARAGAGAREAAASARRPRVRAAEAPRAQGTQGIIIGLLGAPRPALGSPPHSRERGRAEGSAAPASRARGHPAPRALPHTRMGGGAGARLSVDGDVLRDSSALHHCERRRSIGATYWAASRAPRRSLRDRMYYSLTGRDAGGEHGHVGPTLVGTRACWPSARRVPSGAGVPGAVAPAGPHQNPPIPRLRER